MQKEFSIYLDLIRFIAALLVVFHHSITDYNPVGTLFQMGREAVIIFFILSGYVISFVSDTKEKTLKSYAISRLSRIYSVAIPAIIITILADKIGFALNVDAYDPTTIAWDYPVVRVLSSLLFLNEIWFFSIQAFSNVPYWSLSYEVWFYVIFAMTYYFEGKWRWILSIIACLCAGPKILLLMPIWWLGLYIYRCKYIKLLSINAARVLLILSTLAFISYFVFNIRLTGNLFLRDLIPVEYYSKLGWSSAFLTDYILAIIIACHFVAAKVLAKELFSMLVYIEKPIRHFAAITFSLYLLHQPLMLLFRAIYRTETYQTSNYMLVLISTLISAYLLGQFFETKRAFWKNSFVYLFEMLNNMLLKFLNKKNEAG